MKPGELRLSTKQEELRARTKKFALRIVKLFRALPRTTEAQVMGKQLLRCGTSVGANYRAVCRARSRAEFLARIGIVAEEADESVFWLELIAECNLLPTNRIADLVNEAQQLTAIFTAAQRTTKARES